ncbi:cytochrome-c oxidase, cbb3-type subunit II [Candidatus Endoriftia persephone]|jgi:cytochrome c oxidase cbb3-type subunit 2|uniref:Cytochrome c oxidase subunit CcoO n=3 Tax=Gammaproteobacteria TaxID=1236 RepID=G2FHF4_9GAMM|nr:cytochrome-c oxidase, cbb3-type subunit II [Candidatus Endoriftia persephone]EGV51283.1 cytochrome c oxidase subunit CcoO [endosymbiont of Riftia pachyptila (vent Ph05)]EGW53828.1 cytochrome c oxidase subunit CcoO [endosymbiont of Tevnia jerichonana (vent Tica)]USF88537.1 cytochrome-c oxidase, cbb3-type subunit II [Candidatus Endoriftia persephone]
MANNNEAVGMQEKMEKNIWGLLIVLAIALSVGGIVEIVPLFTMSSTFEHNKFPEIVWQRQAGQTLADHKAGDGIRPYTALELAGRDIYQREGCYLCHSQMIRPFRDEKERYGHYSLASESMYDHPMQWGSKRTGPDFARLGGKYSDDWHRKHLRAPRSVVPESVMPNYPWFKNNSVEGVDMAARFKVMKLMGVPYTDEDIASANAELAGKTEEDAVVAYLQVLGTMAKLDDSKVYRE